MIFPKLSEVDEVDINAKQLCLERDAGRCHTCGGTTDVDVVKLIYRPGNVSEYLSNLVTLCKKCDIERKNVPNKSDKVGIILCGGKGTRLYPITKKINKHMLPIGIIPMAFYPIKTLRNFGIKRVLIIVDQLSGPIVEVLGSGKAFGMDFSYKVQDGSFGIADALYLAKDFMTEEEDELVCILGDNIFDNSSLDTDVSLGYHEYGDTGARVYLKQVSNPSDYGVAVIENDNKVTKIIEKPKEFVSDMAVLGLYVYTKSVFDVIESIKPSDRGELEISDVNDYFASRGELESRAVTGYWADCGGSIQRYAEASMYGARKANVSAEEIDNFRSVVFDDK